MANPKKESKPRATKYDDKLAIKGMFKDVFKVVKKNKEQHEHKEEEKPVQKKENS